MKFYALNMLLTISFFYTGLFQMIVGVLTTCHTQYTWDSSICIFLFNRTTIQIFVTLQVPYLYNNIYVYIYVYPLWFYKHQNDNRVRCVWQVVTTPTIILNNPLCCETCRYQCLENRLNGPVVVVVVVVVVHGLINQVPSLHTVFCDSLDVAPFHRHGSSYFC